ncbi:MAG: GIY-YIG nuclease family protein [Patescibacteria group bacterium]|nr:GIY-YIG nuclease family protein [Patescibacteria group bacterium]
MYYVYILLQNDGNLYKGSTDNLKQRIEEHNAGKVISTKHKRPLKLIHYEGYLFKEDAQRREKYLKTTEGRRFLRQQLKIFYIKYNIKSGEVA